MSDLPGKLLLRTNDVAARILDLAPGSCSAWHHHNQVEDHMVCCSGRVTVEYEQEPSVTLCPGEYALVSVGRRHRVCNLGQTPASYLLLQGVGEYDFIT